MTNNSTPQTPAQLRAEAERVEKLILEYEATLKTYKELGAQEDWYHDETYEALRAARLEMETAFLQVGNPPLATAYAEACGQIAALLEQDRWIPVEERLPEDEDEMVMVATQTQRMSGIEKAIRTGFFGKDGRGGYFAVLAGVNGGLRIFGLYHLHDWREVATHWRPLPMPPAPASAEGGTQ